jgi:hypothetical protein
VCQNYVLPKGFELDMSKPLLDFAYEEAKDDMRFIAPFVAAGDLSYVYFINRKQCLRKTNQGITRLSIRRGFDADKTYPLPDGPSLDPVAPPTAPPYKAYLERNRTKQ